MDLNENFSQDQDVEQIDPTGGASQTAFPDVERWIMDSSENRNALEHVLQNHDLTLFRSLVDYVTCLVFPELKPMCMAFYRNMGRPIKEVLTEQQQPIAEKMIVQSLAYSVMVYEAFYQRIALPYTWQEFIKKLRAEIPIAIKKPVIDQVAATQSRRSTI